MNKPVHAPHVINNLNCTNECEKWMIQKTVIKIYSQQKKEGKKGELPYIIE